MNYYDFNVNQSNKIDSSVVETISRRMVNSIMNQILDDNKTNHEIKE